MLFLWLFWEKRYDFYILWESSSFLIIVFIEKDSLPYWRQSFWRLLTSYSSLDQLIYDLLHAHNSGIFIFGYFWFLWTNVSLSFEGLHIFLKKSYMNDSFSGYKILIQNYFFSKCEDIAPLPCKSNVIDGNVIFIDDSLNYKDLLSLKAFRVLILQVLKQNQDMHSYHV